MNFFSDRLIQAACWTLLHSLWQGLLLAFVTGIVMVLSKRSSAALRYNLLSVIFMLFICTVCFTFYRQVSPDAGYAGTTVSPGLANYPDGIHSPAANTGAGRSLQSYVSVFTDYFNTHASLIVTIWFIVFMARCIKILSGLVNVQRLMHYKTNAPSEYWQERISELARQLQINRAVSLLESAIVKVPVVVGFLKPTILVPLGLLANLSPGQVESILIHELAHIRRKDYVFNLLQRFIDILFFFNPTVLWISSLIRNERENCCDDVAITETKSKKQFVQALVSFYEYNKPDSGYAMQFAGRKNRLVNRVKRIVNNNNQTLNSVEKIVLAASLFVFCTVCITISNGQTAAQKKQTQKITTYFTQNNDTVPRPADKKPPARVAREKSKHNRSSQSAVQNTTPVSPAKEIAPVTGLKEPVSELQTAETFKNIQADKLTELQMHDVDEDFVNSLSRIGYKNISSDRLQELKDHGVSADFIGSFYQLGYKDISLQTAEELKDHGVKADFISRFREMGFKDISLEKARELKDHGVHPDFINGFLKLGYKDISLDKAEEMRDHGVNPRFIEDFHGLGYKDISMDKAQTLRDHGVSPDFIKGFNELGFKDFSLDKAIELRDHGVTTGFIESMKKKTGSDHSLDEYIMLRDNYRGMLKSI